MGGRGRKGGKGKGKQAQQAPAPVVDREAEKMRDLIQKRDNGKKLSAKERKLLADYEFEHPNAGKAMKKEEPKDEESKPEGKKGQQQQQGGKKGGKQQQKKQAAGAVTGDDIPEAVVELIRKAISDAIPETGMMGPIDLEFRDRGTDFTTDVSNDIFRAVLEMEGQSGGGKGKKGKKGKKKYANAKSVATKIEACMPYGGDEDICAAVNVQGNGLLCIRLNEDLNNDEEDMMTESENEGIEESKESAEDMKKESSHDDDGDDDDSSDEGDFDETLAIETLKTLVKDAITAAIPESKMVPVGAEFVNEDGIFKTDVAQDIFEGVSELDGPAKKGKGKKGKGKKKYPNARSIAVKIKQQLKDDRLTSIIVLPDGDISIGIDESAFTVATPTPAVTETPVESESEEEEEPIVVEKPKSKKKAATNKFAFSESSDEEEEEEEEEEDMEVEEQKKEVPIVAPPAPVAPKAPAVPPKAKKGSKRARLKNEFGINLEEKAEAEEAALKLLLERREAGSKLSNKERRALENYDRKQADIAAMKERENNPLANFAVTQAAFTGDASLADMGRDIIIEDFSISAEEKPLFQNASLRIVDKRRYGLLGPNGAGKSTLLRLIDARKFHVPSSIDMVYVEQEIDGGDTPAIEVVLAVDERRTELLDGEKDILQRLDEMTDEEAERDAELGEESLQNQLQNIHNEMSAYGLNSRESEARSILAGLGFTAAMQERPTETFSGGWRMRISLARALFMKPTLLMLDEPTNHLDLHAALWLQDYMENWPNTLLVVSHDQDFLDSVSQEIIALDDMKLVYYKGGFYEYKKMSSIRFEKQEKEWKKMDKQIKGFKKGGMSSKQAFEKMQNVLKAKKDLDELKLDTDGLIKRPRDYSVRLEFPDVEDLSPPVIEVLDVEFTYPDGTHIFDNLNFGITLSSRVAVVGPNGAGKSTMLNLITGLIDPLIGEVKRNKHLRIGKYNQHFVDVLPMEKSPVEFLQHTYDQPYQECRNLLGRFGLGGHAHTIPMKDLSGGQKARVVFCAMTLQEPHIIFLDEPTNHLDLETVDALIEAINAFEGGVILVSHDSRLISETECELWICADHKVVPFKGDFDDYKQVLLDEIADVEREAAARAQARADAKQKGYNKRAAQALAKAQMQAKAANMSVESDKEVRMTKKMAEEQEAAKVTALFADMTLKKKKKKKKKKSDDGEAEDGEGKKKKKKKKSKKSDDGEAEAEDGEGKKKKKKKSKDKKEKKEKKEKKKKKSSE